MNYLRSALWMLGLACVFFALGGCSTPVAAPVSTLVPPTVMPTEVPTQAPTVADVAGIWWQIDHPHYDPAYLILRQDGTYTFASNPDGERGASGQYWFEDGKFMISDAFCTIPGEYEVNVKEQKGNPLSLAFSLVEDDCPARVGILTTKEAIWFAPPP